MNLQGKRAAIVTLGCKVNQYETDAMYGMLKEAGVTMVDPKEAADIYIVNTCSVTNMAERKSRQMLHRAKKKNPDVVVVAVGCYAQVGKEELSKDVFSANDMKEKLLNNDNLLGIAVKNFDYDYLDPTSENSKLFEQAIEIGINNNNPSAVRIRQALTDIKSIAKVPLENVAQQGQTFVA